MAHAQKPDFVVLRNGRVHLNRQGPGASVQLTTGSRGVRISSSNAGYTMFRGRVKGTGYQLHSPVSPSLPLPVRQRVPSRLNWILPSCKEIGVTGAIAPCSITSGTYMEMNRQLCTQKESSLTRAWGTSGGLEV